MNNVMKLILHQIFDQIADENKSRENK